MFPDCYCEFTLLVGDNRLVESYLRISVTHTVIPAKQTPRITTSFMMKYYTEYLFSQAQCHC